MLKNYIVTALRNIRKNKLASLITVIGFSLGIACALFIFLFVQYELSFDKFLDGHDRIHRVLLQATTHDGREFVTAETDLRIKDTLLSRRDGIEHLTQIFAADGMFGYEKLHFLEQNNTFLTDVSFLKVFTYPLISGDGPTALEKPMSLVLTRRMAEKYFGAENPVGKTIRYNFTLLGNTTYSLTVTGVLENLPANSSFQFDFLAYVPFERVVNDAVAFANQVYGTNISTERQRDALTRAMRTFIKVKDNSSLPLVHKSLGEAMQRLPQYGDLVTHFRNPRFVTEALDGIYLFSTVTVPAEKRGNFLFLLLLIGLGIIVITIACINVVNLTTARSLTRMKEIGVRKTLGASRRELMVQYLVESVLLSFISLWFAVVLTEVCLPLFNRLIGRELAIGSLVQPLSLLAAGGIALFIGVVSGIYPAFYLSSFNVVGIQRKSKSPSSRRFREVMVVVQFVFSIGLFITSAVILREFQFMKGLDTGFDAKDVVMVRLNMAEPEKKLPDIKIAMRAVPGVVDVSASSLAAWEFGDIVKDYPLVFMGRRSSADIMMADPNYLRIHGIGLLGGKDFDPDWTYTGYKLVVINETAAKELRLKVDSMIFSTGFLGRVVGVAKDFNYLFPSRKVKPLLMVYPSPFLVNQAYAPLPIQVKYLLIKVHSEERQKTLHEAEAVWRALVPEAPFDYRFEEDEIERQLNAVNRSFETVLGISTVLAFLLSGLGLFGLATFEIERRTKEIGIRKALGATSLQIVIHFLKGFTRLIALANLIAWPLTFLLIRLVFELIQYPRPLVIGPLIFLEVGAISLAVMVLMVGAQTLRAAAQNPVTTLRYE